MFWSSLSNLIQTNEVVIDRPKGSCHPNYKDFIYPVDYGYIKNTASMDRNCIDIFIGSSSEISIQGIICTFDSLKKDSEVKVIYKCTESEIEEISRFMNGDYISGIFVRNKESEKSRT